MDIKLVLVEKESNNKVQGTSGIMLDNKYIIITGNIISNTKMLKKYNNLHPPIFETLSETINIIWKQDDLYTVRKADIFTAFSNKDLRENKQFFKDWTVDEEGSNNVNYTLSLFFVLNFRGHSGNIDEFKSILKRWWDLIDSETIAKCDEIYSLNANFGNRNFLNSYSQGIVSNVLGSNSTLIVSDMPTTPGCEGSPVYKSRSLSTTPIGIIISSISWWNGDWIGLTLIADIRSIIMEILSFEPPLQISNNISTNKLVSNIDASLVQIYCGSLRGTGIILNKENGIIITNSHVLENSVWSKPKIFWKSKQATAEIIYKTPTDEVFDLAILTCRDLLNWDVKAVEISLNNFLKIGHTVYNCGYSLFSKECKSSPNITRGCISNCDPYMLKTTAAVHAGASGGAVLDSEGGLIGIIVSNTKLTTAVFPRVNMSVPYSAIRDVIEAYFNSKDKNVLVKLNRKETDVCRAWLNLQCNL